MKKYLTLILVFLVTIEFHKTTFANSQNKNSSNEETVFFINQFATWNLLLSDFVFFGIFSEMDLFKIKKQLNHLGVQLTQKPSPLKVNSNGFETKGSPFGFRYSEDGNIFSLTGSRLQPLKKMDHADLFNYLVSHLEPQKKKTSKLWYNWNSWGLHQAYANNESSGSLGNDKATSAIGFIFKEFFKTTIGDVAYPAYGLLASGFGGFNEFIVLPIKNWLTSGKVYCETRSGASTSDYYVEFYQSNNKNKSLIAQWSEVSSDKNNSCQKKSIMVVEEVLRGHFKTLCQVWGTGSTYLRNSFLVEGEKMKIQKSILEEQLGRPIPPCSPKTALKVEESLKSDLQSRLQKVTQKTMEFIKQNPTGSQVGERTTDANQ